jgi:hypothetical protein
MADPPPVAKAAKMKESISKPLDLDDDDDDDDTSLSSHNLNNIYLPSSKLRDVISKSLTNPLRIVSGEIIAEP